MRAVLCKEFGPPEKLVIEDVPSPEAGKGQVVIDVHAAAVNFPDVLIIQNKYQMKPPLPFSPGGEVAGVVRAVGEGVQNLKVGDRVIGSCGHGGYVEELQISFSKKGESLLTALGLSWVQRSLRTISLLSMAITLPLLTPCA